MHSLTLGSTIDETCTHTHLLACFESLLPFPVFSWAFPFGAACTNFHTRQFHHVSCVLRTCMHVFVGSLSKEKKNRGGSVRISRYVLGTTRRTQRICGDAWSFLPMYSSSQRRGKELVCPTSGSRGREAL
jgi:hypothetical protein